VWEKEKNSGNLGVIICTGVEIGITERNIEDHVYNLIIGNKRKFYVLTSILLSSLILECVIFD